MSIENLKQTDELVSYALENSDNDPLSSTFVSLEESATFEDEEKFDMEPTYFKKIKSQIENKITDLKATVDDLNKMREEAAKLESDLVSLINCSTWENISEFIGMSSTNIIGECMKILDQDHVTSKLNSVLYG